jgi:ATP-binding protein involved in chromosome partitioning
MAERSDETERRLAVLSGGRARPLPPAGDGRPRLLLDVTGLAEHDAAALEARLQAALGGAPLIVRTAERAAPPPGPRRIVAVASGKGGVGKSTVAAGMALALARRGLAVGLLDADIHGPSVPTLLGATARAGLKDKRIQPVEAQGLKALSMGWMADPDRALAWRGPMASAAMAQMVSEADWGPLDLLVVDMPPGTGDVTLTLAQKVRPAGVVIVSTPQDLALIDARRALQLFRQLGTPVLGLVENMSIFCCPACGERTPIFGEGGVEAEAARLGLPLLGRLPLDPAIRAAADAGAPLSDPFEPAAIAMLARLEELAHAA